MSADRKTDFGKREIESNSRIVAFGYGSGGPSDEDIEMILRVLGKPQHLGAAANDIRILRDGVDCIQVIANNSKVLDATVAAFGRIGGVWMEK